MAFEDKSLTCRDCGGTFVFTFDGFASLEKVEPVSIDLIDIDAGSGIGAWGGALRVDYNSGRVLERYPLYYAIGQLMGYLRDSRSVTRVPMPDPRSRVYRIDRPAGPVIVAWRDPQGVLLPGDGAPATEADVPATGRQATVEAVITSVGQTEPGRTTHEVNGGQVRIRLTHTPVFVSSR